MRRFKKILAFVNGPDSVVSLKRAIHLAEENQAEVLALDVLSPPSPLFQAFSGSEIADGLRRNLVREREEELQAMVANRVRPGMAASAKVVVGTPFIEIIREVIREEYDLVVKTAEGHSLSGQRVFGGTAFYLMRQCPCPVWIVKPQHDRPLNRVMAAVDVEVDSHVNNGLNNNILKIATSLSLMEGAELQIVHVWSRWEEDLLKSHFPAHDWHRVLKEQEKSTADALGKLLEPFNIDPGSPQVKLIEGAPGCVIPELVNVAQIELLVMGTVRQSGMPGFMIGKTAEQVLHDVDCSVLTLKPDGFKSAVELTECL